MKCLGDIELKIEPREIIKDFFLDSININEE